MERLTLRWCVENHVPLKQVDKLGNVLVVRYENLVGDSSIWEKILQHIGCKDPELDAMRRVCALATHTSRRRSPGDRNISATELQLSSGQVSCIRAMVRRFGLDEYLQQNIPGEH